MPLIVFVEMSSVSFIHFSDLSYCYSCINMARYYCGSIVCQQSLLCCCMCLFITDFCDFYCC